MAAKSVAEEAQRRCGPTVTDGEGVARDGRGTPKNVQEDVAELKEDRVR
jgi:hypothetical protein